MRSREEQERRDIERSATHSGTRVERLEARGVGSGVFAGTARWYTGEYTLAYLRAYAALTPSADADARPCMRSRSGPCMRSRSGAPHGMMPHTMHHVLVAGAGPVPLCPAPLSRALPPMAHNVCCALGSAATPWLWPGLSCHPNCGPDHDWNANSVPKPNPNANSDPTLDPDANPRLRWQCWMQSSRAAMRPLGTSRCCCCGNGKECMVTMRNLCGG